MRLLEREAYSPAPRPSMNSGAHLAPRVKRPQPARLEHSHEHRPTADSCTTSRRPRERESPPPPPPQTFLCRIAWASFPSPSSLLQTAERFRTAERATRRPVLLRLVLPAGPSFPATEAAPRRAWLFHEARALESKPVLPCCAPTAQATPEASFLPGPGIPG